MSFFYWKPLRKFEPYNSLNGYEFKKKKGFPGGPVSFLLSTEKGNYREKSNGKLGSWLRRAYPFGGQTEKNVRIMKKKRVYL
jgi:hypothetical protein